MPDYLKEMAIFQPGSWWVMKNEQNNTFDSTSISATSIFYSRIVNRPELKVYNEYIQSTGMGTELGNFSLYGQVNKVYQGWNWLSGYTCRDTTSNELNLQEGIIYWGREDSLFTQDTVYTNAYHFENPRVFINITPNTGVFAIHYYFLPRVGLVRFSVTGTDIVWSLLRWHTVQ
jgi:hypothetical protein